MATDKVTVWVMEHDDPEVRWVVNDLSDMQGNLDDNPQDMTVEEYCSTWTELEMPRGLWLTGSRAEVNAWVEAQVTGRG